MGSDLFLAALRPRVSDTARSWLEAAVEAAAHSPHTELLRLYTAVASRVGRRPLALDAAEQASFAGACPDLPFDRWMLEDAARAALLLARGAAESAPGPSDEAFVSAALACYDNGDSREQQSWLRALSLLPHADRFLASAIDACRTNILPQFEAIACDNPYPARYFPDRNFNQLVLKALFNSVSLSRIVGLPARANAELTRMAEDYASERRAAGRPVPADISLAMKASGEPMEQPR